MINRDLLDSIIKDIREDSWEMERVDKTGQAHGWAARFRAYAEALEGHIPHAKLPTTISKDELIEHSKVKDRPEDDEDFVPVATTEGN
jgi:hypothetical protein